MLIYQQFLVFPPGLAWQGNFRRAKKYEEYKNSGKIMQNEIKMFDISGVFG